MKSLYNLQIILHILYVVFPSNRQSSSALLLFKLPFTVVLQASTMDAREIQTLEPHHDVKLFNRWSFDDVEVPIFCFINRCLVFLKSFPDSQSVKTCLLVYEN